VRHFTSPDGSISTDTLDLPSDSLNSPRLQGGFLRKVISTRFFYFPRPICLFSNERASYAIYVYFRIELELTTPRATLQEWWVAACSMDNLYSHPYVCIPKFSFTGPAGQQEQFE
jgi:hypothetical protein